MVVPPLDAEGRKDPFDQAAGNHGIASKNLSIFPMHFLEEIT
jgi:hypothetical protein